MYFKAPRLKVNGGFRTLFSRSYPVILIILLVSLMAACQPDSSQQEYFTIPVNVDGQQIAITTLSGKSVEQALTANGILLGDLDRTLPPRDVALTSATTITITRVEHVIEIIEEDIPFATNILPNETLAQGERRIIQAGANGLQEITYQHLIEDGKEISKTIIAKTVLLEPQDEIIMEGVQSPNVPVVINGKIAYLTAGNAWLMNGSTTNRQPLVTTGDLDWHILELSPDGQWLLFSRKSLEENPDVINTLWVVNTATTNAKPIDLGVINVIHFARWLNSEPRTIVYSTVEKRTMAPGWQANNDLQIIKFTSDGGVFSPIKWLEPNSGGVYGWWGDSFEIQPGEKNIAILRPDGIDLLAYGFHDSAKLVDLLTYQTHGSWSWVTQANWNQDGTVIYAVNHRDDGSSIPEGSPHFDLDVIFLADKSRQTLRQDVGMFAYPSVSPVYDTGTFLAYLQASFSLTSDTSPYRLMVADIDGSNAQEVFPREGAEGMLPQVVQWQPAGSESTQRLIAVVYLGNIWLVDVQTGFLQQVTGDGLTERISWK